MMTFKDWFVIREAVPATGTGQAPAAAIPTVNKPTVPTNTPAAGQETDAQRKTRLALQAKETENAANSLKRAADAMRQLGIVTKNGAT
jgi:hypothetical protein